MARLNSVASFRGTTKTKDGNLRCGKCGDTITRGQPYLWWANRTPGSRSGYRRIRCTKPGCRPMPWEYQTTSPHRAALMQGAHYGAVAVGEVSADYDDPGAMAEAVADAVHSAAEYVREAADGYTESATNIEDGFGHPTYQSEELQGKGEALTSQADDLDTWEPDTEQPVRDDDTDDADWGEIVDTYLSDLQDEATDAIDQGTEEAY